jgi:M6 family metalloprotease-like protein
MLAISIFTIRQNQMNMSKKKSLYLLFFSLLIILNSIDSVAVPAYPFPVRYKQPDGSTLSLIMKGDEKVRWAETIDGYTLIRNHAGGWEYAKKDLDGNLVNSGILAKDISNRSVIDESLLLSTPKKLHFSTSQVNILKQASMMKSSAMKTAFPTNGSINVLMILIQFKDVKFSKTKSDFENLMNQVNYNRTGSLKDFYFENSFGQLTINTTVAGIYTAANNMTYYGTNTPSDDYRVRELINEAFTAADTDVNYANFDNDKDGKVDGVYVIYAGYGEEAGGGSMPDAIWAHASSITPLNLDGVQVSKYACSCEIRGNSGSNITGIGVICHEFGHSLGAPDYYDTNYETDGQYPGNSSWDVMSGGNWNDDGDSPAHHNPYTKSKVYHWATATILTNAQNVKLRDIKSFPDIVQFNTKTPNEYFLCENRQWTGFNYWLPGHGMIIYHVDGDYIAGHDYTINAGEHQGMYVVSAAATTKNGIMEDGNIDTEDCPWPGTGGITSFNDQTTPCSKSWDLRKTETPLKNITESDNIISFDIEFGSLSNFTATPVSTSQISLAWTKNTHSDPVMIAVSTNSTFGIPSDGISYSAGNVIPGGGTVIYNSSGNSFDHTSLASGTQYFYKAWSISGSNIYSEGVTTNASTLCGKLTLPFTETFNGTTIPSCWSQSDNQGNGQIWQFGTTSDFGGDAINLSNGNYAFLNSDDYGDGNSQNADLISPTIDMSGFSLVNIQFDYFHQYWSGTDASANLSYSLDDGLTWTSIHQWTSTSANPATFSQLVPALDGQSSVKIKWNYSATYGGGWAIDNISVTGTPTVPSDLNLSGRTVENGETTCFDAQNIITVAGSSPVVFSNGSVETLIAGKSIYFMPGFIAQLGSSMDAYITTDATFCDDLSASPLAEKSISSQIARPDVKEISSSDKEIKVYPNPCNGKVTLELVNFNGLSTVSIINTSGTVIQKTEIFNDKSRNFDLSRFNAGIYFVLVKNGEEVKTSKIIVK